MGLIGIALILLTCSGLTRVECWTKPQICNLPVSLLCSSPSAAEMCRVKELCFTKEEGYVPDAPRVNLTVYYESLCPYCQCFLLGQVSMAMEMIGDIINLELVPFGNADEKKVGDHWVFNCQHGPAECYGNILETCSIAIIKNITKSFPFVVCLEMIHATFLESLKICGTGFDIPTDKILACANGTMGNELEHKMAVKTIADRPKKPYEFAPFVRVNGVYSDALFTDAEKDLIRLICDIYTGPTPKGCGVPPVQYNYRYLEE